MKMPIDVKEVLDAATDIDAARKIPVSVAVFFDKSAPADLQDCVRSAFAATGSTYTRVLLGSYPALTAALEPGTDVAVLVAGLDESTGMLAQSIRQAGTPVMVVTTMPELVKQIAQTAGYPLLVDDIVAPNVEQDSGVLAADEDFDKEPYPLSMDRTNSLLLNMGRWIVDAFREKRLAFALSFPFVRRPLSVESVNATSMQNAGIGLVAIIPGADMPVMTLNQAKMLLQIAAAYGQKLGMERLKELAAIVGGGFACRAVARQLVSVVPGWGWAVKAGIGYTGTLAMGYACIAYFEQAGEGSSLKDAAAAAQAEAARVAAAASREATPQAAAAAAAKAVASDIASGAQNAAKNALPALKKAVDGVCEAAGTTPAQLGRQVIGTVMSSRKKN